MSNPELGILEQHVLRALRTQSSATAEQLAAQLPNTGASSVVKANAALARNSLVEPVPGEPGAMRLTAAGSKLVDELPPTDVDSPGSGGGASAFN